MDEANGRCAEDLKRKQGQGQCRIAVKKEDHGGTKTSEKNRSSIWIFLKKISCPSSLIINARAPCTPSHQKLLEDPCVDPPIVRVDFQAEHNKRINPMA